MNEKKIAAAAVCPVCPHHCVLGEGQSGRCRARKNKSGKIVSINYAKVTSLMADPIEKKAAASFFSGKYSAFGRQLRLQSGMSVLPEL